MTPSPQKATPSTVRPETRRFKPNYGPTFNVRAFNQFIPLSLTKICSLFREYEVLPNSRGVYIISLDLADTHPVYIGSANNIRRRLNSAHHALIAVKKYCASHRGDKPIIYCCTDKDMYGWDFNHRALEDFLIHNLNPQMNKVGRSGEPETSIAIN